MLAQLHRPTSFLTVSNDRKPNSVGRLLVPNDLQALFEVHVYKYTRRMNKNTASGPLGTQLRFRTDMGGEKHPQREGLEPLAMTMGPDRGIASSVSLSEVVQALDVRFHTHTHTGKMLPVKPHTHFPYALKSSRRATRMTSVGCWKKKLRGMSIIF